MPLTREIDAFLSEKRAHKREKRRRRQWREQQANKARYAAIAAAFGKRSHVIKMLANSYAGDVERHRGGLRLSIPQTFSVIEAPDYALATVGSFAKACVNRRPRSVFLDHSKMTSYDLAANAILDVVAVELKTETSRVKGKLRWRGSYPKDHDLRRFIKALGIIKHLGLEHEFPEPEEAAELRLFDVRNRHYFRLASPEKADFKTKVVTRFSDHIDACLRDHGRTLTAEARHNLCEYTGEILDNAEEHANFLDWTIEGYLDNSLAIPLCEIAIFNFGDTIAETLKRLPRVSYTSQQIAPYMSHYRRFKWFGPSWSEDDLLTLIALQGHVSSQNHTAEDTRGNGTIDLIEFFQRVHAECAAECPIAPKMAILSGSTHILFDGTYKTAPNAVGSKIIAFNRNNDLNERPDSNYVKGLRGFHFPGTAISIRFPLSVAAKTAPIKGTDAAAAARSATTRN